MKLCDVDFERRTVFIKKQKGKIDRYVPLNDHLARGLKTYIQTENPHEYLFNSQVTDNGKPLPMNTNGIRWVISLCKKMPNTALCLFLIAVIYKYITPEN